MSPNHSLAVARPFSPQQIEILIVYLLLVPQVSREAIKPGSNRSHLLMPEDFALPSEVPYQVIWNCFLECSRITNNNVTRTILEAEVDASFFAVTQRDESHPLYNFYIEAMNCIEWIYGPHLNPAELPVSYGITLLKDFLNERVLVLPAKNYWQQFGSSIPAAATDFLQLQKQTADTIRGINGIASFGLFDDDMSVADNRDIFSTGLPYLDVPMDGGWKAGEITMLFGPSGSGKTRIACMTSVEAAQRESIRAMAQNRTPKKVYLFTWEMTAKEIRVRQLSYAARIPRKRLEALVPWSERLSSSTLGRELQPYESLSSVQNSGSLVMGEWERLQEVRPLLENLRVFDMRPSQDNPMIGSGHIGEIVSAIEKENQDGVCLIVLDFLQSIIDRRIAHYPGMTDKLKTQMLTAFGAEARHHLANRFECPVLVLEQLSGTSNAKSPTARQTYADSLNCKTTYINADWTFQMGTPDKQRSFCVLWHGKTRRAEGCRKDYSILKYRSEFDDFYEEDSYVISNGQFIDSKTHSFVGGMSNENFQQPEVHVDTNDF